MEPSRSDGGACSPVVLPGRYERVIAFTVAPQKGRGVAGLGLQDDAQGLALAFVEFGGFQALTDLLGDAPADGFGEASFVILIQTGAPVDEGDEGAVHDRL